MTPRKLAIALLAAWMGMTSAATATENLVVIELYTSQGCSSCPPADGLLAEIASRPDILALSLHVDYWDYIGWKDQFADPRHTARQKSYARLHNQRSVYTPQMVVGGSDFIVGFKPMELADLIQAHARQTPGAVITARRSGDLVEVAVSGALRQAPMVVVAVSYDPSQTVEIRRGENAGRTLTYHNIVTGWTPIGEWNGSGTFRTKVRMATSGELAIIVQERGPGPMVTAARVP